MLVFDECATRRTGCWNCGHHLAIHGDTALDRIVGTWHAAAEPIKVLDIQRGTAEKGNAGAFFQYGARRHGDAALQRGGFVQAQLLRLQDEHGISTAGQVRRALNGMRDVDPRVLDVDQVQRVVGAEPVTGGKNEKKE